MRLVYIDDVINTLIQSTGKKNKKLNYEEIPIEYRISLRNLAEKIKNFKNVRSSKVIPPVGTGIERALYSTYLSYLPLDQIKYPVVAHKDPRGEFIEFLKTQHSGQFSIFTAEKGVTRGGHYHHTKNEKFLVIKGKARFRLRNLVTHETAELNVSEKKMEVVDMPPGWVHDITNTGNDTLVVMLWANEIFDPETPDTIYSTLEKA